MLTRPRPAHPEKVLVHLRDGRKLIGVLRSYDQYANLVLTQTIERLFHRPSKSYAQTDRGVFLIRGENVVLLGEIDLDAEDAPLEALTQVPWDSIAGLLASEKKDIERRERKKEGVLFKQKGFGEEGGEGDSYKDT
ncbi:U6 snRNA-associated Sm-like protein LSm1 [Pseudohyphozyma bogoriensis]|nr:U6 snRNA-associated Sm-like protein LSm1 [Pseudohyphozyma bogoriensis]